MRFTRHRTTAKQAGYALMLTMLFAGIGVILLASILQSTSNESGITARNTAYHVAVAAAEAGTEMVIARMDRDFISQNVNPDLNVYRTLVPTSIQADWPMQFQFSDGLGNLDQTRVESLNPAVVTNLNSEFQGLFGFVLPYRITSQARLLNQRYDPPAAVSQEVQFASIPVFQFAIFYTIDLEINPGPTMRITGKVHSNGDIYAAPVSGLTFDDAVTAVGKIYNNRHPNDPTGGAKVAPVYRDTHMEKVSALTLPVGPDNSPDSVRAILDPPPAGEDPNSNLGKERFYNKADLIIQTTDSGVQLLAGQWANFAPIAPDVTNGSATSYSFIKTDTSLNDLRETKWVILTEVDVGALKTWLTDPKKGQAINGQAQFRTGHGINSIYVDDQRTRSGKLTGVRVVNGQSLPNDGLTVATPLPLYVKGHFNAPTPGSTNTANTKPAALIGDAITILSANWNDNNAGKSLAQRAATSTTVNAALLGGIVKSTKVGNNKYYSGGVENFPRFLEDWNGDTLTYNGSMVVMFESRFATKFWQAPGNYYNAPTRQWAFDVNFLNPSRLPPMTPQFKKLVRGQWRVVAAR
jgi:hypothetical protein